MNTKPAELSTLNRESVKSSVGSTIAITAVFACLLIQGGVAEPYEALIFLTAGLTVIVSTDGGRKTRLITALAVFTAVLIATLTNHSAFDERAPMFMLLFMASGYLIISNPPLFTVTVVATLLLTVGYDLFLIWIVFALAALTYSKAVSRETSSYNALQMEAVLNKYFLTAAIALTFLIFLASFQAETIILPGKDYYHTNPEPVV